MPPTKSRPPRFKALNRKTSTFKRRLLALLSVLATVNYTVVVVLHHVQTNNWMASYQELFMLTNRDSPRKRIGIGSKHFRSMAHRHNVSRDCHEVASDAVLDVWKNDSTIVCSALHPPETTATWFSKGNNSILVEEFVLRSWEYEPTFVRYQNVEGYWGGGIRPLPCPRALLRHEQWGRITHEKPPWAVDPRDMDHIPMRNASDIVQVYETVLQVQMFEQHNAYERFHAYLNAAMVMRMFDIADPQLVLVLGKGIMLPNTLEMWRSMSTLEPIVVDITKPYSPMEGERLKLFRELIHVSSSGTSILVTVAGSFRGRGADHHCKSTLFRDITQWTAMNFDIQLKSTKMANVTQIVWSSRSPYCCVDNQTLFVKRSMNDEDRLLRVLTEYLGPQYNITKVDFGTISTRKSIELASQTDILMGVHGAGLIWAAFMPIHGGLIEIFGGDRAKNNRHYHNVASLADLHYRELSLSGMDPIGWDNNTARELVRLVQSIEPNHEKIEPD